MLCDLAISTGSSISISSTYILFLAKLQKNKPCEMDWPLLENDIATFELALKYGIHSKYSKY